MNKIRKKNIWRTDKLIKQPSNQMDTKTKNRQTSKQTKCYKETELSVTDWI